MRVNGIPRRGVRLGEDGRSVEIIDQTLLPHRFETRRLDTLDDAIDAIRHMWVRGAPLIGATAAFGMALAMRADPSDHGLAEAARRLPMARPTAVNLAWATARVEAILRPLPAAARAEAASRAAVEIAEEDVAINAAIGGHGLALLRDIAARKKPGERVNVLTHCNAGWLATVDWGTATAPIYMAHEAGIDVHVYVDETRPRNQGASLTAWELGNHGVPHTLIVDNAGGHLMRLGMVDICFVGTDRVAANGDVCNKIGTYLKALAARDNGVPFHVAAPSPSIDFALADGAGIPIEFRGEEEVLEMSGLAADGRMETVRIAPAGTRALNPGFDVTPARLVSGLITERGIVAASPEGLASAFPERAGPIPAARG
jgi:methylthioribose-1-phosphate isomerase